MSYLVIKCGGSVLEQLPAAFYKNIASIARDYLYQPIIVHGGGPMVSSLLTELNMETKFVDGMRVTTEEVLDVVEMALSGSVNKKIVRHIIANGGSAVGLSGVDGMLLEAKVLVHQQGLGFVGEVIAVNTMELESISSQGKIPVISPVAIDKQGQRWNVNADLAAAAVAKALQAPLYMMTNVPGVLKQGNLRTKLTTSEAEAMITSSHIHGGMIPKVQAALDSLQQGVNEVVILNGLEINSLPRLLQGEEIGTSFSLDKIET
ncbi:acetylglutamate kinase [Lentibacillus sp. Marseille-P4043]|uniref:acetylglutamate kinase n=1 Tax=Lentibacillus sp. Marseille-P4043 TaxID=2040293 RepID=UPI000D0BBF3E|nr:acetylglutamate kinase [Lentibacillus sp. Marseille-P4043]